MRIERKCLKNDHLNNISTCYPEINSLSEQSSDFSSNYLIFPISI